MGKKHLHHLALATLVLAAWPLSSAKSQAPAAVAVGAPAANATGALPCVLLENDNVLFGRAFQVGEFVIVQTRAGGEVQLSRKEVVCWAGSIRDLYRYRVDHRQKGDVAAHLRDARWCFRYDLFDLAEEEIRAIKAIDPRNAQAKSIADQLNRVTSPVSVDDSSLIKQPSQVQPVGFENVGRELGSGDLVTLRGFARRVQPMLLNRCGRCHAHDSERKWTLLLPPSGARASSRMTRENLAASLQYINRDAPEASELLIKATTPHGGGPSPLDPRSAMAIGSLQRWLVTASKALPKSSATSSVSDTSSPAPVSAPSIAERAEVVDTETASDDRLDQPARLPQVANPFDPELFNRRFHAESSGEK